MGGAGPVLLPIALAFALGLGAGATVGPFRAATGSVLPPRAAAAAQPSRTVHPVDVLRVIDGDTFEARVHLWPGLDLATRVRLRGIDAPELRARCGAERAKAETAREALQALLDEGEVGIAHVAPDKYGGRVVADASTRTTPDVAAALLSAGVARRYSGGRRDGWCP